MSKKVSFRIDEGRLAELAEIVDFLGLRNDRAGIEYCIKQVYKITVLKNSLLDSKGKDTISIDTSIVDTISTDSISTYSSIKKKGFLEYEPKKKEESFQQMFFSSKLKTAIPYGEAFNEALGRWFELVRHRSGKPLTPDQQLAQLKLIVDTCGSDEQRAIDMINYSITQNYKGLYENRDRKKGKSGTSFNRDTLEAIISQKFGTDDK